MRIAKYSTVTGLAMTAALFIGCASSDYETSERIDHTAPELASSDRHASSDYRYSVPGSSSTTSMYDRGLSSANAYSGSATMTGESLPGEVIVITDEDLETNATISSAREASLRGQTGSETTTIATDVATDSGTTYVDANASTTAASAGPSRDFQSGVQTDLTEVDARQSTPSRDFRSGVMHDEGYASRPLGTDTQAGVDNTRLRMGYTGTTAAIISEPNAETQLTERQDLQPVAGSRWDSWTQNVSNETASAKDEIDRKIAKIDSDLEQALKEKEQLRTEIDERLVKLEGEREELENQLDTLYAQGDRALPSFSRELQTARLNQEQLDARASREEQARIDRLAEERIITDVEAADMEAGTERLDAIDVDANETNE